MLIVSCVLFSDTISGSQLCNLDRYSLFGRIPVSVKIKVHNVFYTHTSIYSKLILTMVSNMFYNFLDFLTQ